MNTDNRSDIKRAQISLSVDEWHEIALEGTQIPVTFKLSGESMRPLIRKQRDSVTVIPVYRKLKKGDIVLFKRFDSAYVVHRVNKIDGQSVTTVGDNCTEFDAPMSICDVWGIVVKENRDGKILNLDSAVSRIYGRMRMFTRPVRSLWRKIKRFGASLIRRLEGGG